MRTTRRWPLLLMAAPAGTATWSGWVGLGGLCGFGPVRLLPGIDPHVVLNTAITLPIGVEAYGAYALGAWLGGPEGPARKFARRSAIGSLAFGMLGQVAYHLLSAAHATRAPWPVTVLVACMPAVVLGLGAGLAHLLRAEATTAEKPEGERVLEAEPVTLLPEATGMPAISGAPTALSALRPARPGEVSQACAKWTPQVQQILAELPSITGAGLGRQLGVSARHGQRIMARLRQDSIISLTHE